MRYFILAVLVLASAQAATAQQPAQPDSAFLAGLVWRNIGPANMSGRVTDIEGLPSPSKTFYVAAATGGIWKTTNNGTTFREVFASTQDRAISMGDLAIAPSDTLQVWAGTGEEDSRNSISPGGGVFKSADGGNTWRFMGLKDTHTIGRIVVHPTDPNIVYVAALGHIWGANAERGLYKTTDGGATWERIKHISDRAGFVDLVMHPTNPDVLFASSWERVRGPYFMRSGGAGSALWKTTDGGRSWTEVEGGGFPATTKGRIGLALARSSPDVVYTLVEADTASDKKRLSVLPGSPKSGLYRSADGGATWQQMNSNNVRPFYYSQVRVDPSDENRVYWSSTPVNFSKDGGKTIGTATLGIHVDHHAFWWDPADPNHFIVGNDGGVAQTWDKGGTFDFLNHFPIGQFYAVSYDLAVPYNVCGGLQDNGTWCGPSRRAGGDITNAMWFTVWGGDGFVTAQDPRDPAIVYGESQRGRMGRINVATGERKSLSPPDWRLGIRPLEDTIALLEADTAAARTAETQARIRALRARISADSAALDFRFNWNTPFVLSPHDPDVLYAGSNRVLKSTRRGEELRAISPDLSYADPEKIRVSTRASGGITRDVTGAENFATIVSLAESPRRKGLLFAGTDDGRVWLSRNDGGDWEELTARIRGVRGFYVSRIEPSPHDENVFYVTFDNHRNDDFTPYVFTTTDGGRTFRSIAHGLPSGGPDFVHVIREDPVNPNLLFVGTDVGLYMSLDRGASWRRFMNGLPTVPVHDLKIHPRDHELIAATHGRSIWVVDIAPLQQLGRVTVAGDPVLFEPKPALQHADRPIGGESTGHKTFRGASPQYGAEITYWVPPAAGDTTSTRRPDRPTPPDRQRRAPPPQARIVILGPAGDTVQTLNGPLRPGLQRAYWNLRARADRTPLTPAERRDSADFAQRVRVVADSMIRAGTDKDLAERAVTAILTGDRAALSRGVGEGRGAPAGFAERPGESYPPEARTGQRPGATAPGEGDVGEIARQIVQVMRDRGQLRGGGGFGGFNPRRGPQRSAHPQPGEYTVLVTVGGRTLSQKLRLVRAPGFVGLNEGLGFEER